LSDFLAFAHQLADAAGVAIRPYFGTAVNVETKSDNSPVSIADREAEAAIRALIEKHYPAHGIYGEEYGTVRVESHPEPERVSEAKGENLPSGKYTWVIDPIDGTRAFLAGSKEWGTLIALCEDGVPILGILDQPVTGERWVGVAEGDGTYSTTGGKTVGEVLMTHGCPTFSAAKISTTSGPYFTLEQANSYVKLAKKCAKIIEGGDCYAYGLLARGQRDLVVEAGLKPYDILALVPIIEAAGGRITDWHGAPITLTNYSTVLASGDPSLHKEALAILNQPL